MTSDSALLPVLWRRKWIVLATVVIFVAAAAIVSQTVAKVYETSADLLIVQAGTTQSFDAVQAAQVSARTYGAIITSPTVAQLVSDELGGRLSRGDLEAKVTADPVPETQLLRVTVSDESPEEAKRLADVYTRVFVDYVKTRLSPATRVSVSVAGVPSVPTAPTKPQPRLYVLVALLVGLGVGVALAFLRERLDTRARSPEQIEAELGLPILARLPRLGRGQLDQKKLTEALRLTRATLPPLPNGRHIESIAVTSHSAGEGKSTTVSHLALAAASSGGRVLVVEADLRRPALQKFFVPQTTEPLKPGLTSFVVGSAPVSAVTHPTRFPSVELVPAGPPIPSLSSLLQSDRGHDLIQRLSPEGRLTLFDLPPLAAGADAATVAAGVDGVILVIDIEQATRTDLHESVRQLNAVRANVLGLIINRDRTVDTVQYGYET